MSLMSLSVQALQTKIGYTFRNSRVCWEALQAPGAVVRNGELPVSAPAVHHSIGFRRLVDGNRRLAILGDTVLKLVLVQDWYHSRDVRERADRIVSSLATNYNLARIGSKYHIDKNINANPAQRTRPLDPSTVAGTMEAIFGAIYLDSGLDDVSKVIKNLGLRPTTFRKIKQAEPKPTDSSDTGDDKTETSTSSPGTSRIYTMNSTFPPRELRHDRSIVHQRRVAAQTAHQERRRAESPEKPQDDLEKAEPPLI